jgi:hypothetical protein
MDKDVQLSAKCKECGAACTGVDRNLCKVHARTFYVAPAPSLTTQTVQPPRLPPSKDRLTRLPSLGVNGWAVNSRQVSHQVLRNGNYAQIASLKISNGSYSPSSGSLTLKARRPRDLNQRIIHGERQPSETLLAEQSKLKITNTDGLQTWTIDDDMPIEDLEKQCEQRECLDNTPYAPLDHQPRTKSPILRMRGSVGSGIVTRAPIAIIRNPPIGGSFSK